MDLTELAYLLNSWRVFFALKVASPSGLATKGNPNWTVRIEGEVSLAS
jgi:hypothetical protein